MNALPRFLCDEMLSRLCHYLRAAGYDTLLAQNGTSDAELLQLCRAEGRHFLTQDKLVCEHKAARAVALILPHVSLTNLAALLTENYQLDWLSQSFTRCLMDNTLLVAADEAAQARAPEDAIRPDEKLYQCPICRRIYWRGSHYKRIREKLVAWQATRTNPSTYCSMEVLKTQLVE
jgi:uncharacterized protein with PIN domain